jgi:predicted  nucleic acid-binding Zn-ribbon protein
MIEKEIKEYKQGNDTVQRINIRKIDNFKGKVCILEINEYKELITENKTLKEKVAKQNNEINELKETVFIQKKEDKTIQSMMEIQQKTIGEISRQKDETIEKLDKQHHEILKELGHQHQDKLEQIYDKFNEELKKYITLINYKTQH